MRPPGQPRVSLSIFGGAIGPGKSTLLDQTSVAKLLDLQAFSFVADAAPVEFPLEHVRGGSSTTGNGDY